MNKMWYIIYQITNLINQMIYVGKHSTTTPYDLKEYFGSSEWLKSTINKHGNQNFKRETLFVFEAEEEAFQKEAEIVDLEFVNREDTYNLMVGGKGFSSGLNNPNFGKQRSGEIKEKIRNALKGKLFSKERCKNLELKPEIIKQRREDIKNEPKIRGWTLRLSKKWNVDKTVVSHFTTKYASDLHTSIDFNVVIKQRRQDILNDSKTRGYQLRLSKKWGITMPNTCLFIEKYAKDLSLPFDLVIEQRRQDIKNEPKVWGWRKRLSKKWGLHPSTTYQFINKHALDLMS